MMNSGRHQMKLMVAFVALIGLCMAAAAPRSVSAPFAHLQIAFTVALLAGMGHHDMLIRRIALGLLLIGGAALFVWMREPQLQVREAAAARPVP